MKAIDTLNPVCRGCGNATGSNACYCPSCGQRLCPECAKKNDGLCRRCFTPLDRFC